MATRTTSASSVSALPPAAGSRVSVRLFCACHLGAEAEGHTLLSQDALELLGDLAVHAGHDAIEELDDRDLGAEAAPHRPHLQPDIAAADHHQVARHLRQRQRAGRSDDLLFVDLDARQRHHLGARGDDDVLGLNRLSAGAIGRDRNLVPAEQARRALDVGDLVFVEQELDALGEVGDDLVLAAHHRRQVERRAVDLHAVRRQPVRRFLVKVRGLQQRLRGNAADIEAGPAKRTALLDAGGLETELRCADGAHIAAGSAADDDEVELSIRHGCIPPNGFEFTISARGAAAPAPPPARASCRSS
jgi:hypothetical protein